MKKENATNKLVWTACIVAALYLPVAVADDYNTDTDRSHPGTFVKDSVITTKVKTKLAAKHMSTLTSIKVDTDDHGIVWLTGTAPTKDASDLATMIAKDTEGVTAVHNKIVVTE